MSHRDSASPFRCVHDAQRAPSHLALLQDLPPGIPNPSQQSLIRHTFNIKFNINLISNQPLLLLIAEWGHGIK